MPTTPALPAGGHSHWLGPANMGNECSQSPEGGWSTHLEAPGFIHILPNRLPWLLAFQLELSEKQEPRCWLTSCSSSSSIPARGPARFLFTQRGISLPVSSPKHLRTSLT